MLIEICSDIVCPWCYVGKRRLAAALAARPDLDVEIRWLPFELNPDLPAEGMDRVGYMVQRFGDANRFAAGQAQLADLGAGLDIDFRFDRITRMSNTRRAHVLLAFAAREGRADDVVERLFRARFTEGLDVGDAAVLEAIATAAGLDAAAAARALDDPARHAEVEALEQQVRQWGITGVPAFVIERRYLLSGAQEPAAFIEALEACAREGAGTA